MSTEAGKQVFSSAKKEILSSIGASESDLQRLEAELKVHHDNRDWPKVSEAATKLARLSNLRSAILGIEDPFAAILEQYSPEGLPTSGNQDGQVTERKHGRNPEKYLANAQARVGLAMIQKDENGQFYFKSLREVGLTILQEKQRHDPESIQDAVNHASEDAKDIAKNILVQARRHEAKTITDLLKKAQPKQIKIEEWKELYKRMRADYGRMSPERFSKQVLLRFHRKRLIRRLIKEIGGKGKSKQHETRLGPADLMPQDELTLCNRLTHDETFKLLGNVLGGRDPLKVAKEHGFTCSKASFQECLEENRQKMAALRNSQQFEETQRRISIQRIQQVIRIMAKDRRGWHQINPDYHAFKFTYSLIGAISHDEGKVEGLINALFPEKVYRIDPASSLLLPGTESGTI